MAEPTRVEAYADGDVELFHPELNAIMAVPQGSVDQWKAAGWVDAKRKEK